METHISKLTAKVANVTALAFISGLIILGFVSILGIWDFLDDDVVEKSFATIGLLVFVTVIILIATKYLGKNEVVAPLSIFASIQRITVGTLIISSALLALVGILSIWEILDGVSVGRSVASLAIIAFISLITVMICLERKGSKTMQHHLSPGRMIGWLFFIAIVYLLLTNLSHWLF